MRKAEAAGITWRRIDDPAEREKLAHLAGDWERVNPNAHYRNPNPATTELLVHRLFLAAFAADGRPLVLSVTPADGAWALLLAYKSMEASAEQSLARYFLMPVLVEHLVRAGVRHLFDGTSPMRLPRGLRHYQRMVGFRTYRLKVDRAARWAAVQLAGPRTYAQE